MRNFTITVGILSLLLSPFLSLAATEISDGSIKALYHFEDTADASGNGNNLTEISSPSYTTGKLSNGGDTNGTAQWSAASSAWDWDTDYSIGFWIKPFASVNDKRFVSRGTNPNTDGIVYGNVCAANELELLHDYTNQACRHNAATLNTDTWYWMLITRDGTTFDWYIDNSLVFTGTDSKLTNTAATIYINGTINGADYEGDFMIDELFFANARLSTSTRTALYNSGNGSEICVTAGCGSGGGSSSSTSSSTTMTSYDELKYVVLAFAFFCIVAYGAYRLFK